MSSLKIVLDPGHGPKDKEGCIKGFYEGTNNYQACILLKKELERYFNVSVVMTRNKLNDNPANPIRGKMGQEADLFYSWHSNGHEKSTAIGVTTYHSIYIDDTKLGKAIATRVAELIGNGCYNRGQKTRLYDEKEHSNRDYYNVIRNSVLINGDKLNKEPIRSNCEHSLIVEHGFHSNPYECAFLSKESNLKKIVKIEAEEIAKFFNLELIGDVNGDGVVDSKDAELIKNHIMWGKPLTDHQIQLADINQDGRVSIADFIAIKRLYLNIFA